MDGFDPSPPPAGVGPENPPLRCVPTSIHRDLTVRPARASLLRTTRERTDAMTSPIPSLRADLERRDIDHRPLSDTEVFHLACALRGWHVTPRTAANTGPIDARVWLAAALASGGRYPPPPARGPPPHPADAGPPPRFVRPHAGG